MRLDGVMITSHSRFESNLESRWLIGFETLHCVYGMVLYDG